MKYNPPSEKELEIGVQSALQAYRSRHQALIVNAIVEAFPEKDVLSLPVLERMHLKAREKSLEELGEKLTLLVLQNLMPRINQPIP
ncbi:hypothetical protein FRB95_012590 [Tulasnella sp. JGI-2019a]|nr:hypothetical protein FRB93_011789 [Tulasnella sp. JGI-2019a]KAG9034769.1 hypothetical protein FRB95_012590 [Tulasnella sp. JGI-2019a]